MKHLIANCSVVPFGWFGAIPGVVGGIGIVRNFQDAIQYYALNRTWGSGLRIRQAVVHQ